MAGKRLNKKLIIVLTLAVFAAMVALSIVMLSQLQRRDPKYFVELAEEARAQSQWEHAILYYKEAWQRSRDATHLLRLGEVLLSNGDVQHALASWQHALVNEPTLMEAHRRRLELLLDAARFGERIRAWEQVREAAQNMLDVQTDPNDAERAFAHHAQGVALIHLQTQDPSNVERGQGELEKATELAPDSVDYPLELAAHYFREGDTERADRILHDLLEQHGAPGAASAKVRTALARHLAIRRLFAEAEEYFQEGVALAEGNPEALQEAQLAHAAFLSQKWARAIRDKTGSTDAQPVFDRAERILLGCIQADPDNYDPYLYLALLYKSSGRHADVLDVCEQRLQRGLERKGADASRNRISTFRLMIHASDACIAQAIAAEQEGDNGAQDERLRRAQQYVVDAEGESPNHPRVLSQAARVKVARGELRAALKDLRAAEEAYRSFSAVNWDNVVVLARVHLRLNEPGAAREAIEQVLDEAGSRRPSDPAFWTLYGQTLLQTNELDRALRVADRMLQINPENADARRLKAAIYERQGKRTEAGRLFAELTGDRAVRAMLAAREHTLEGDLEKAVSILRAALEELPAEPRLVAALVHELTNLGRPQEARKVVADALAHQPDHVHLKKLAVFVQEDLSTEQRDEATLALIEAETDAYKRSLDRVSFYLARKDPAKTLKAINDALGHVERKDTALARGATLAQHRALLRAKIRVAAQLEDTAALEAAREDAIRLDVDGVGGKTLLGLYHMARKEFELAIGAFREALSAQPTDAWSLTHLAQSLQALGRAEEARDAYQRAIHINPNEALARKGLAGLAKVRGDLAAYETHLDVCRRLIPKDPWVQSEMLAQEEQADPAAAITRREELAAENPDDVGNLRRLASLCETIHDLTRADAYYDRILALRSDDRDTILLAARYYRRTDRAERALDLLNRFTASRPTASQRADAQILVAGHHLTQGHNDRAEEALLAAAKSTETPEPARSLAQFYRTTRDDPRRALVWFDKAVDRARQTQSPLLPRVLEARAACRLDHRINDTASAGRDVAELLERFPNESSGYLLNSEILALEGRIDEAVAALSEHLSKRPNDPYALYRRARHEATRGRLAGAIADLETAKRAAPLALRLEPRILLANLYDRSDRKDLWIHELESLAEEAPDDPRALEELVRAYLRERRSDDADRIITAQINRTRDKPDAGWFQLRGTVSLEVGEFEKALGDFHRAAQIEDFSAASLTQVLDAYLQIGRYADGVAYGRQHAMESRNNPVLLSRYGALLARSGQIEEAVEQLHRAMARALADKPEAALVVAGALPTALADPADLAQAVTLLQRRPAQGVAGRARDRLLARLHQMADRWDDAIEVLESLIQKADGDNERATLLQEIGDVHQIADHPDRARKAYEEGLKYDPDNWVALNNLAFLLTNELDQSEHALPYARRAVGLTDNPAALDTLGWTYVGLQQYPEAIAELSRATRLAPDDASTLYHLGEAYRRDGQFAEATGVLQNALGIAQTQGDNHLQQRIEDARARARQHDAAP